MQKKIRDLEATVERLSDIGMEQRYTHCNNADFGPSGMSPLDDRVMRMPIESKHPVGSYQLPLTIRWPAPQIAMHRPTPLRHRLPLEETRAKG
jgi:hypothetical protein